MVGRLPRLAHGGLVAVEVATAARTVSRQTAGPASLSAPILLSYLQSQNRAFRDDKTLSDVVVPFVGVAPVTLLQVRAAEDAAAVIRMLAEREAAVQGALARAEVDKQEALEDLRLKSADEHREAMEEAGCELSDLVPMASYFPSAGACSVNQSNRIPSARIMTGMAFSRA